MTKIFISYRRSDSRKDAGRIYDRLVEAFGKDNVFKDVDSIRMGKDFRGALREAVAQCDVQLVIIGKTWLTVADETTGKRRLDNPGDWVRIEVESALQRDSCLVIPVLVDSASMPRADELPPDLRELAFKNGTPVRDDPDFHGDVTKIIRDLGGDAAPMPKPSASFDVHAAISRYFQLFDDKNWDEAKGLLAVIRASGKAPRLFDVDAQEAQIWDAIEEEARDKDYEVLRLMARRARPVGIWDALQAFWQSYPGYDPDNLARFKPAPPPPPAPARPRSIDLLPTPFAWIDIPGGRGTMKTDESDVTLTIPTQRYWIAKYPVTNAQYRLFIEAGGYKERQWWTDAGWEVKAKGWEWKDGKFVETGTAWAVPRYWSDGTWNGAVQPVVGVSWYEAVAFCQWLSETAGERIMLPTEAQWQYAAQGDDGRDFPWGSEWDCMKCSNSVRPCDSHATTPVRTYEGIGDSPFGVVDMAGNVWEWCLTDYNNGTNDMNSSAEKRVLRGGSWNLNGSGGLRAAFRFWNDPVFWGSFIGFRCARSS